MRHLKRITLAATAALALTGFLGISHASATTLEITGVTKNESVTITASLKNVTSSGWRDTFGFLVNTCIESHMAGQTEKNFSTTPTGALAWLSWGNCDHTVTVHKPGKLYIEWISGTTNGRIYSEEAEFTTYSTIHGTHINCTTGAGTLIGTLTGLKHGQATMDIVATLNCGPHLSSAKWVGTYAVTTPEGLGISP